MHRYRIKPNKCVILISVSSITSDREIGDKMLRLQHFSPEMNVDNEGKLKKLKSFGFTRSGSLNHAPAREFTKEIHDFREYCKYGHVRQAMAKANP